ncbi:hypothetical protein EBT16_09755, partial [bacterium]|nr:hypothetical protein [bacterium]
MRLKKDLPAAWLDHDKKIRPYLWSHRVLGISSSLLSLLLFVSFIVTYRFVRLEQAPVILGSATPSLESAYNSDR